MKALTETRTCMCLCFHVVSSAVSNPQMKRTNSPSSYRLCCLTVWITQFSEVSLKFTVWSQQRRLFSCQTIVSNRCRKTFQTDLFSLSLSACVFFCLSPSSSPSWSISSGRPDAAAAAVSRLHAPDQHVICQIGHLSAALSHLGTLLLKVNFM